MTITHSLSKFLALLTVLAAAAVWASCGSDTATPEPTATPRVAPSSGQTGTTSTGRQPERPTSLAKTNQRNMNDPRQAFGAVKLDDGKVLVIGGIGPYGSFPLVEEYDPATDTWTTKARMLTSRAFSPAIRDAGRSDSGHGRLG